MDSIPVRWAVPCLSYEDANYQHEIISHGNTTLLSSKHWLAKTGVFFSHNQKTAAAEQVDLKVL
jgi:hypothetical protein